MTVGNKSIAGAMHRSINDDNTYFFLNGLASILVSGEDTNGEFCIIHFTGKKDAGPPLHIHEAEDETFLVVEGELEIQIGDEIIHAKAGDYVFAPRGIPHAPKTISETSQIVVTNYPAGFDRFVKEMSVPYHKGMEKPEGPPSAELIKKLFEVSEKYKITYPSL
ncbi:quercetin dioxygenase-like cupin family protein [Paenibacillus taihuensis]|uniref:Quercetin dioxygenase-like cupin family protein n=1 Tax=Paenibacillus taihuensis TaxID=1156355 RepID=A0A3D9R5F2_9BACL|nr:quercetin 2,3-dioxygenase [Paenibacillus taihuensis]REE69639.1 quercetin dioxygenase-like cupin family protein [Paenibacillus taihuensis]